MIRTEEIKEIDEDIMKNLVVAFSLLMVVFIYFDFMHKQADCKNFVPDEKTAVKIAEAVWLPIYGDVIFQKQPFVAELGDDDVWKVTGTLKTQKGGVPYIEIQKCDCKILKVSHSK